MLVLFSLSDLVTNPLLAVIIGVVVPISLVAFILYRLGYFSIRPRGREAQDNTAVNQVEKRTETAEQENKGVEVKGELLNGEEVVKAITSRIDKLQLDLSKSMNENYSQLKGVMEKVSESIENAVLAIKAEQSDQRSPFNVVLPSERDHEVKGNIKEELSIGVDLERFIKLCTLIELMDYNHEKISSLYDLRILSAEDMEIILKVEQFIKENNGKYRAKDLAIIGYKIASSYGRASVEMKKSILLLTGGEENGKPGNI